jgi:putative serine protease PepD
MESSGLTPGNQTPNQQPPGQGSTSGPAYGLPTPPVSESQTTASEPPKRSRAGAWARRGAPLLAAGAIGAGIAFGIGTAVGLGSSDTTVVQQQVSPGAQTAQAEGTAPPATFTSEGENLSIEEIYKRAAPGVVEIRATSQGNDGGFGGIQEALGSGFVIDKAGHIVTNYHVVEGATELSVSFSGEEPVPATVVGSDPSTDIAVIKVDVPASALSPLVLGDSDAVTVGDAVVAIGNPFGLDRTITAGIVSAVQRNITAPNNFQIDHVIQTDAAINHGNSGGPLLNSRGEVIGVNAQIQGGSVDGNIGIGFAIPVNTVKAIASQLIESGKVEHPYLGVTLQEITQDLAQNFRLPVDQGVLIGSVQPDTPAEDAGLEGGDTPVTLNGENYTLGGDIIVKVDGQAVTTVDDVREAILAKKPGDTITLEINRDGQTMTVSVELGRQPATTG